MSAARLDAGDERVVTAKKQGVILLSRAWPERAFLYASLQEAGVDVLGVESPADAEAALWAWPERFGLVVVDVRGFARKDLDRLFSRAGPGGPGLLVLAGPFESVSLPARKPAGLRVIPKPVAVAEVVRAVCQALGLTAG